MEQTIPKINRLLDMTPREYDALKRATSALRNAQPKPQRVKTRSGIRGIYWQFDKNRWNINVCHEGKQMYVGISTCLETAKAIQQRKVKQLIRENKLPENYEV
jgi:hypothetical protein